MKIKREKEKKENSVLFVMKISAFLLFVVIPVLAWQKGQNFWTKLHDKEDEQ